MWRLSGARAAWLAAGLALLLAPAVRERIGWAGYLARERLAEVERPAVLAGMRVEEPERDFLRWLDDLHAAIAQADGGAGAVMFGQDAMMIVPDRSGGGIGPYYVTWGGLIPAEAQRERWGWILAKRPAVLAHRMKSEVLDRFVKNERYTRAGRYDGADLDVYVPEEWVGRFVWPDTGEAAR